MRLKKHPVFSYFSVAMGPAFEKTAKKANEMNVKNKTKPQDAAGRPPKVDAALFCVVNEM